MKCTYYSCDSDLKEYVSPMLFDSGHTIASADFETDGYKISLYLDIRGNVAVWYDGEWYKQPSLFPENIKEMFRTNTLEDVIIDENNWFEVVYNMENKATGKTKEDGIIFEEDLSKMFPSDLLVVLEKYAKKIIARGY